MFQECINAVNGKNIVTMSVLPYIVQVLDKKMKKSIMEQIWMKIGNLNISTGGEFIV